MRSREPGAAHVLEEERGAAVLGDAIGDRRDLEEGVDGARDAHELRALLERANESAHAVPSHRSRLRTFKII